MINYPIQFQASAETTSGIQSQWKIEASNFKTTCSIPESFEGPGGTFSPEDFFLLSLQNCFIATFKVFAEYSRFSYESLSVQALLTVDKDTAEKPCMKSVHLKIHLLGVTDLKKAQLLANKTLESGFILRSVKTELTSEIKFN